eukprot:CAMPEP_0172205358 /NCGR_PEP_ID=MMETSP1050-20130122/32556_1 /TAXON_ID=233186 /ORGANISM="Cryptomonas curvata, Strain CCAP979/52" /LENGTH=59 /DNA_ID=CAMNT_0012884197 /DNA_START=13 /DNA_END=189 /DNA_ORIENTATION=+
MPPRLGKEPGRDGVVRAWQPRRASLHAPPPSLLRDGEARIERDGQAQCDKMVDENTAEI